MKFLENSIDSLKGQGTTTQFELHAMNIQELFRSIYKIPFYQRPYDWEESDILGLITDIFNQSTEFNVHAKTRSLQSKFIGTIVLAPQKPPAVKASQIVYDIVDGQQRITTLQLLLCQLHCLLVESASDLIDIEEKVSTIDNEKSQDMFHWLNQHISEARRSILEALYTESDKNPRSALVNFIPRLIREEKDRWGVELTDTDLRFQYKSGPSLFLFNYLYNNKQEILKLSVTTNDNEESGKVSRYVEDNSSERYLLVEKRAKFIKKSITDLINTKVYEDEQLVKEVRVELTACLSEDEDGSIVKKLSYIYFLIGFSLYLLNKVSTVVVVANNESEAFDIFDSLNTTGEPLNAIQVLNALVVSYEINYKDESDYASTHSKDLMDGISRFINSKDSLEERSNLIYEILNSYKTSQTGSALRGKQLSTQIDAIKNFYGGNEVEESLKVGVLKSLFGLVSFYKEVWSNNDKSLYKNNLDVQVLFSTKHTVVIPVLNYFYNSNKEEFEEAVKAVIAFSVLWRVMNGGTAGIDNIYKKLFNKNEGLFCSSKLHIQVVSVKDLKAELYTTLEGKLNSKVDDGDLTFLKDKFIRLSAYNNFYNLKRFAKYFLICALENTKPNDEENKQTLLTDTGTRKSTLSLLRMDYWDKYQIEHIAPQAKSYGWDDDIYENINVIDYIGNTTILPKNENIELSNESLNNKVKLYKLYSADSSGDFDRELSELISNGVLKSKGTVNNTYLKTVGHLKNLKEWNKASVEDHSVELLSLGWDYLIDRLKP